MESRLTFRKVLQESIDCDELVEQFNRLFGCELLVDRRCQIDRMVDGATGYDGFMKKGRLSGR